eukprot:15353818-Ditylum_brightwellii.AAC.1
MGVLKDRADAQLLLLCLHCICPTRGQQLEQQSTTYVKTHGRQHDSHGLQSKNAINMKNGTSSAINFVQIEDDRPNIVPPITIPP